jgi:3-oxoacyl-[acyl-carrier-protein] synthase II
VTTSLWVTGTGLVTPLGIGVEATWSRLVRGDRAIRSVRGFDTSGQRVAIAGEVDGVVVDGNGWSRTSAMAATAAEEAMRAARLDVRSVRTGLVVGGTTGGMFETEEFLARLHAEPECREALGRMLSHPLTATGDRMDERLGPFARVRSLSSACSSGANALVVAACWLLSGEVDAVVAGGSDGLCRLTLSGFNALGALDPEPCRPFDRRRRGTSLGEGAGFLVIERAESARARGAMPIAELAGWASGSEAHHITNPAADGTVVASLIRRAIARAGITPSDVDYVNAHGTGTRLNDTMEASALVQALGVESSRIPVSSSKAQIGHTLGAAGAIEAAITALVVQRSTLVPTAGLEDPEPEGLVHVPGRGREVPRVRAAVSSAFGFGGMDTVLVFAQPRENAGAALPPRRTVLITGAAVARREGIAGASQCATLVDHPPRDGVRLDAEEPLDPMRARRFDAATRLGVLAVGRALSDAGARAAEAGLVLGSAFGNVDGSAGFMHRIFDRGPRSAGPAEFPNLVPSTPVGHVSIYLGLHGPSFATADLATSGESAFVQAAELVGAGEADAIVGGALEPRSGIVERILAGLFALRPFDEGAERQDLAVALVLESERNAATRNAPVLARVKQILEWRGDGVSAIEGLEPPDGPLSEVILARRHGGEEELLERTPWASCARIVCAPGFGESHGLGAVALAVATGRIVAGLAREVLVVGIAKSRGYSILLATP